MDNKILRRFLGLFLSVAIVLSGILVPVVYADDVMRMSPFSSNRDATDSSDNGDGIAKSAADEFAKAKKSKNATRKSASNSSSKSAVSSGDNLSSTGNAKSKPSAKTQVKPGSDLELSVQADVQTPTQYICSQLENDSENAWGIAANGTYQHPYIVSSVAHFLAVQSKFTSCGNDIVYFKLTQNIDLSYDTNGTAYAANAKWSSLTLSQIVKRFKDENVFQENDTVSSLFAKNGLLRMNGWLISSDPVTGKAIRFTGGMTVDDENVRPTISGLDIEYDSSNTVALFGYLSQRSQIENIGFENITILHRVLGVDALSALCIKNDGKILGCTFNNINLRTSNTSSSSSYTSYESGGVEVLRCYNGIGTVAADNCGQIRNVQLNNIHITTLDYRSYVGGVVAQNRGVVGGFDDDGTVTDVTVNGLKISVSSTNDYVGGIAGANILTDDLVGRDDIGIVNCRLNFVNNDVADTLSENISGGNYVGGISGYSNGKVENCAACGNVTNEMDADASHNNIVANGDGFVFGAIVGTDKGEINKCTALNVGAYHSSGIGTVYGGISGVEEGTISGCLSTGSTASFADASLRFAVGGIVGKVIGHTSETISNSYTLVKIANSNIALGAVIGVGGKAGYLSSVYWSSDISGRPTSCSYDGVKTNDISLYGSLDKNVILSQGNSKQCNLSDIGWTWSSASSVVLNNAMISSIVSLDDGVATVSVNNGVLSISGVAANGGGTDILLPVNIQIPSAVGYSDISNTVSQKMSVSVMVMTGSYSGTGLDKDHPIEISTYGQLKLMKYAPSAHYKLAENIVMNDNTWEPFDFSGTFDGNGKTITAKERLFSSVLGEIGGSSIDETHTLGSLDCGYVHDFTYELSADTSRGVFGLISNAALVNVTAESAASVYVNLYADAVADGDGEVCKAAFINRISGNSYIYNCYTDIVNVRTDADYSAGFVGMIDADNANIISCGSSTNIRLRGSQANPQYCASFVACIDNCTGHIKDCYASGAVYFNSGSGIVYGKINSDGHFNGLYNGSSTANGFGFENMVFSIRNKTDKSCATHYGTSAGSASGVSEWKLNAVGRLAYGTPLTVKTNIPDIARFSDRNFTVRIVNNLGVTYSNISASVVSVSESGEIQFSLTLDSNVTVSSAYVSLLHNNTVLTAWATVSTNAGLIKDDETGYYLIETAEDLVTLSETYTLDKNYYEVVTNSDGTVTRPKFKIVADIDMTDVAITPIGEPPEGKMEQPFVGEFTADLNSDGIPFAIKNLSMRDADTANLNNLGLFKEIGSGACITNIRFENPSLTISATAESAGIIAASARSACTISNVTIINPVVTSSRENTGGVIGQINVLTTPAGDSITFSNVVIIGNESGSGIISTGSHVGGLVGNVKGNMPLNIDNCSVNNIDVVGLNAVGGFIGDGITDAITISNSSVVSTNGNKIRASKTEAHTVSTSNETSTSGAGGFVGWLGFLLSSTDTGKVSKVTGNCLVQGYRIENYISAVAANNYSSAAGGVVGMGVFSATDVVVDSCNITGIYSGGICGSLWNVKRSVNVSKCDVRNTHIYTNKVNGATNLPFSLATHMSANAGIIASLGYANIVGVNISHCNVDGNTVIGKIYEGDTTGVYGANIAAGVLGYMANSKLNISYCKVSAKLETSAASRNFVLAGGALGATYSGSTVKSSNISIAFSEFSCSLNAKSSTKGYEGGVLGGFLLKSSSTYATADTYKNFIHDCTVKCKFSSNAAGRGWLIGDIADGAGYKNLVANSSATTVKGELVYNNYYSSYSYPENINAVDKNSEPYKNVAAFYGSAADYSAIATTENARDINRPIDANGAYVSPSVAGSFVSGGVSSVYIVKYLSNGSSVGLPLTIESKSGVVLDSSSTSSVIRYPNSTGFGITAEGWKAESTVILNVNNSNSSLEIVPKLSGSTYVYAEFTKNYVDSQDSNSTFSTSLLVGFPVVSDVAEFEALYEDTVAHGEAGSVTNPYMITNAYDLHNVSGVAYRDKHFVIVNDIDIDDIRDYGTAWTPICPTSGAPFTGTIKGYDVTEEEYVKRTIRNLIYSSASDGAVGLFGYVSGATIENMIIEAPNVAGTNCVGALVGCVQASSTNATNITNVDIINPKVEGNTNNSDYSDGVGGIVGMVKGSDSSASAVSKIVTISDCNVVSNGDSVSSIIKSYGYVGGILGKTEDSKIGVTINNCKVSGIKINNAAQSGSTYFAGGIAADMNGTVSNCTVSDASVLGLGAGGIVGTTTCDCEGISLTISDCNVNVENDACIVKATNGTANSASYDAIYTPAGGILAMMGNENCTYTIEDCNVVDVNISAYSVAAGAIGSINSVTYNGSTAASLITAEISGIKVLSTDISTSMFYTNSDTLMYATASLIGYIGTKCGYSVGANDNQTGLKVSDCVAGGSVFGRNKVGGLVGSINYVNDSLANLNFMSDCVVSAMLSCDNSNSAMGLVTGSYNIMNMSDADNSMFKCVYYSDYSYESGSDSECTLLFGPNQNVISTRYKVTDETCKYIYNLNNVVFNGTATEINWSESTTAVTQDQLTIVPDKALPSGVSVSGCITDFGFIKSPGTDFYKEFKLIDVTAKNSKLVSFNATSDSEGYYGSLSIVLSDRTGGMTDIVFEYDCGIKVSVKFKTEVGGLQGSGTLGDPYLISVAGDLEKIQSYIDDVASDFDGVLYFAQTDDIEITDDIESKSSIISTKKDSGYVSVCYFGYNDEVKTIKGLELSSEDKDVNVGFFDVFTHSINNIEFEDCSASGKSNVGIVAGTAMGGTISNCSVTGGSSVTMDGNWYNAMSSGAGCLVGCATGGLSSLLIEDCIIDDTVSVTSNVSAGGLLGIDNAIGALTIIRCQSYATVNSNGSSSTIGNASSLLGYIAKNTVIDNIRIDNSVASGILSSKYSAGGVIGGINNSAKSRSEDAANPLISNTITSAAIVDSRSGYAGKIVGNTQSKLSSAEDIFGSIYYSTYPDDIALVNDVALNNYIKANFAVDVSICEGIDSNGDPALVSPVQFSIDSATGEYSEIISITGASKNNFTVYIQNSYDNSDIEVCGKKLSVLGIESVEKEGSKVSFGVYNSDSKNVGVTFAEPCAEVVEVELFGGLKIKTIASYNYFKGSGTESAPFLIEEQYDLELLATMKDTTGKYFKQVNDIALTYVDSNGNPIEFTPIGKESKFNGTYIGDGHKITNLYINSPDDDNVGFFSYIGSEASVSGIHIELMKNVVDSTVAGGILGGKNVGGLAGTSECKSITNCSVAYGQVNGASNVGGLIGSVIGGSAEDGATIDGCFTSTEVNAQTTVSGGIVGEASENVNIIKSFSTSYVYAAGYYAGGILGTAAYLSDVSITDTLFNGSVLNSFVDNSTRQARETVFIGRAVSSNINIERNIIGGTFIDTDFSKLNSRRNSTEVEIHPVYIVAYADVNSSFSLGNQLTNYYDSSTIGVSVTDNENSVFSKIIDYEVTGNSVENEGKKLVTAATSDELSNGSLPGGLDDSTWMVESGKYPHLVMMDDYSDEFSLLASLNVHLGSVDKEENTDITRGYTNVLSISNQLETDDGTVDVTFRSSKLFPDSDDFTYSDDFDRKLYGNWEAGDTGLVDDRAVDVLFRDGETDDDNETYIYRNRFNIENNYDESVTDGVVSPYGYENYDRRVPTVIASIGSIEREIKIPFKTTENDIYVFTEFQLRELTKTDGNSIYDKFIRSIEGSTGSSITSRGFIHKTVHISADIDVNNAVSYNGFKLYEAVLDGHNHTVEGIYINSNSTSNVGFITETHGAQDNVTVIKDLTINDVNVDVNANYVGGLAGRVGDYVNITNCEIGKSKEYTVTEDGESVTRMTAIASTGSYVGGFIGSAEGENTVIENCSCSTDVDGTNFVGGFIGSAKVKVINNSFAVGNVTVDNAVSDINSKQIGIGGFAGKIDLQYATEASQIISRANNVGIEACFASGNVTVNSVSDFVTNESCGIGGFAGYVCNSTTDGRTHYITICFSSGNVEVQDIGNVVSGSNCGIGGFSGYVAENTIINDYYTSSSTSASMAEGKTVNGLAAAGGVCGISRTQTENTYTSNSVQFADATSGCVSVTNNSGKYVGAIVGYAGVLPSRCVFDSNRQTIGSDYKYAVGGNGSSGSLSDSVKGVTTRELCFDQINSRDEFNFNVAFSASSWGASDSAYPYLSAFMKEGVSEKIKYPAILSVIAVIYDERDESVKNGRGLTMAFTVPIAVAGENLEWNPTSEDAIMNYSIDGNTVTPKRTKNANEDISLGVNVVGKKEYAYREYTVTCAKMCGTKEYPYLIANNNDFKYIGISPTQASEIPDVQVGTDKNGDPIVLPDLHSKWFTHIDDTESPITNLDSDSSSSFIDNPEIYFKLMTDMDLEDVEALTGDSVNVEDNSYSYAGTVSGSPFTYHGIDINGCGCSLVNYSDSSALFKVIDENSTIHDVYVKDMLITDTVSSNDDLALIGKNNGTIKNVIISGTVEKSNGNSNVAALAAINNGSILSTVSEVSVSGNSGIAGGLVGINYGEIGFVEDNDTVTAYPVIVNANVTSTGKSGGLCGKNTGTIKNAVTMGYVSDGVSGTDCGGFVGYNSGTVSESYSRAAISCNTEGNFGAFAGTNTKNSTISDAYAAGLIKLLNGNADTLTKNSIFCSNNSGTMSNVMADKAAAGMDTYRVLGDAAITEDVFNFNPDGKFVVGNDVYPQLKAVADYDIEDAYVTVTDSNGEEAEEPIVLLGMSDIIKSYSKLSTVAVNTKSSHYIDSLPTGFTSIARVGVCDSKAITYAVSNRNVLTRSGFELTSTASAGSADLEATISIKPKYADAYNALLTIQMNTVSTSPCNKNFSGGLGTESDPYVVSNANQFASLAYYGKDPEVYCKMNSDVDLADLDNLYKGDKGSLAYPIENMEGVFDGDNGYVIKSFVMSDVNSGLFGSVGGTVKNVGVYDAKAKISDVESGLVGVLANEVKDGGVIENCYANVDLSISDSDGLVVGGLVADVLGGGTVRNCITSGYIDCDVDNAKIGGVAGTVQSDAAVTDCLSTVFIGSKADGCEIGGIVGKLQSGAKLLNSVYASSISNSDEDASIGLIAGSANSGANIANCAYDAQNTALTTVIGDNTDDKSNSVTAYSTNKLKALVKDGWSNSDSTYSTPFELNDDSSSSYKKGFLFAVTPIVLTIGESKGGVDNYGTVRFNDVDSDNSKSGVEMSTPGLTDYLDITNGNDQCVGKVLSDYDGDDEIMVKIDLKLDKNGSGYTARRHTELYTVKVVFGLKVIFNDTSSSLGSKTIGGLIYLPHRSSETTEHFFTTISGQNSINLDDVSVARSKNGFYIDAKLPEGYEISSVSAEYDDSDVSTVLAQPEIVNNRYFVELCDADDVNVLIQEESSVTVTVNVRKSDEIWGIRSDWDSLAS